MTKTLDPQTADTEAAAAHEAVDEAERAIASGRRFDVDKLTSLVTRARHADLTAQAARAQAERDREHVRRGALSGVASQVDAIAEAGVEGLAEAFAEIAAAAARARQAARAWDEQLAGVDEAASALGCRAPAPGGPREADERVAITRDGKVYHGETLLQPVGAQLEAALNYALRGDVESAEASIVITKHAPAPKRADHYLRGRGGMIVAVDDLTEHQRLQLCTGQLAELPEPEVRAYLAGDQ